MRTVYRQTDETVDETTVFLRSHSDEQEGPGGVKYWVTYTEYPDGVLVVTREEIP